MTWETILVTGGCGFIGTNFIRFLFEHAGFSGNLVNVDRLSYAANPKNLLEIQERFSQRYCFYHINICDGASLSRVFENHPIDAVCHFAAESHVDRSIRNPEEFLSTNVMGTFRLLELARSHGVRLFHHVSTDEVYGSLGEEGAFTEQSPYRPNSPYSASKAASDHLVRAYHHTYELPVTISNCSNNYGPYQFPEKLIPLMIIRGAEWKPLPVYGDGRNVRDWLHVDDHCQAIWTIMGRGRSGDTYNVGGGAEMQNLALVQILCDLLDERIPPPPGKSRRELITFVQDRPGHDRRYAIDATKIATELGWKPSRDFREGLRETVRWYLDRESWVREVQSGDYLRWIQDHYGVTP
jgi:dTDP-glucose 4,6-dehydratase